MARFFFHITNGITFKDEVGEDYSSLEEAMAEAAKIATDLAEDRDYDRYAVLVTDEHGNEVARVQSARLISRRLASSSGPSFGVVPTGPLGMRLSR
jgi:hypothetical protein